MSTHILWIYMNDTMKWHNHTSTSTYSSCTAVVDLKRVCFWSSWSCVKYLYVCFIRHFDGQSYGFIGPFDLCGSNTAIESIYFTSLLSLWCSSQIDECTKFCVGVCVVCVCAMCMHHREKRASKIEILNHCYSMITHMTNRLANSQHRKIHVIQLW